MRLCVLVCRKWWFFVNGYGWDCFLLWWVWLVVGCFWWCWCKCCGNILVSCWCGFVWVIILILFLCWIVLCRIWCWLIIWIGCWLMRVGCCFIWVIWNCGNWIVCVIGLIFLRRWDCCVFGLGLLVVLCCCIVIMMIMFLCRYGVVSVFGWYCCIMISIFIWRRLMLFCLDCFLIWIIWIWSVFCWCVRWYWCVVRCSWGRCFIFWWGGIIRWVYWVFCCWVIVGCGGGYWCWML